VLVLATSAVDDGLQQCIEARDADCRQAGKGCCWQFLQRGEEEKRGEEERRGGDGKTNRAWHVHQSLA